MYKRRRKDNLYKIHQTNVDSHEPSEDYTADCETYDFINDEQKNNADFVSHAEKPTSYQDSYESLKSDFSHLLTEEESNDEFICRDFVRNICRRGRKCKFKHPISIKRPWLVKNENPETTSQFEVNFCHDFQNHGCSRPQCRFIHCNRSEQEFYYATGILLSSVFTNNSNLPYCKDYLNNACTRVKCKFLHLSKDEIEQAKIPECVTNQAVEYTNYTRQSSIEQNVIQSLPGISNTANFYSNFRDHYPPSQKISVVPTQTISLGNSLPLTNAQFTVSLPLGSVSYSTSQQQLITQPSLTNLQYIHDPILSSVALEVGPINTDVLNQLPASNHLSVMSQIQPQQVVYSSIIHNPGVSLSQHHPLQSQFTLISSDTQNHSQLLSTPLPVGSSNAPAHIINPVAVAHPNPSQNQQYTISQQPPVGMSIFSVATPCSLLSAPPTTGEVMHSIQQQQQMRSFDQSDQTCIVQKSLQPNTNIDLTVNDNSHMNSTLTPVYIQHNLTSTVPVSQYRVAALETTTTPGLVIHNALDHKNLQLLQTTNTSIKPSDRLINSSDIQDDHKLNFPKFNNIRKKYCGKDKIDQYSKIIKENEKLKLKVIDLQKQTSDLQTANELLLDQNARLRNFKSCCNGVGNNVSLDSKSILNHESDDRTHITHNPMFTSLQHNTSSPISNQSIISKQNEVISNSMSEMATITLTVPISLPHSNSPSDYSTGGFNSMTSQNSYTSDVLLPSNKLKMSSAEISYLLSNNSDDPLYKTICTTTECSDYISPTLVSNALRSIQKSVMPTLHALVASSNAIKSEDYSGKKQQPKDDNLVINPNESAIIEIPIRSSSCPVTCTYKSIPEKVTKCHESTSSAKICCLRLSNFNQTPQLCFQ